MHAEDLRKFLRELPIAIALLLAATLYLTVLSAPRSTTMAVEHVHDIIAMAE